MDTPSVCRLTLKASRWVENITPHPKSYLANYWKHLTLEGSSLVAEHSGKCILKGVVKIAGVVSRRRVTLLRHRDLKTIAQTWSDPETGEYSFEYIAEGKYLVVCDDYGQTYNAAVADWVAPTKIG
jgi:hypothetical protein